MAQTAQTAQTAVRVVGTAGATGTTGTTGTEAAPFARRWLFARGGGLLAAGGVLSAACGAGGGSGQQAAPAPGAVPGGTLHAVVNNPALIDRWTPGAEAFTREHPQLKIEFTPVSGGGWGGYFEKVAVLVASGTPPDIIRIATEGVQFFHHKGMLLPLDPLIKRDANAEPMRGYLKDVHEDMLKSQQYNGQQATLPQGMNIPVIHYNTALFEKAGIPRPPDTWTIDDFERIARQFARPGDNPPVWGFRTTAALWGGMNPFLYIAGTDWLTDDWKQSRANDPRTVEAVERFQGYSTRLNIAPPNADPATEAWNTGRLAMLHGGSNSARGFVAAGMRDFDILPMPRWRTQVHCFGSSCIGISRATKQREAAWLLLKFANREDQLLTWNDGTVPARRSLIPKLPESLNLASADGPPKNHRLYGEVQKYGLRAVTSPPEFNEVETAVLKHLRQVMNNETGVRAAMDNLHRELTEVLSRRSAPAG
jgi:multiple sugar transport system substrate-binding protein